MEPIDFRSLCDSYATWLALISTPDRVIQRRMGHASASTTDRYIKAAESLNLSSWNPYQTVLIATNVTLQ